MTLTALTVQLQQLTQLVGTLSLTLVANTLWAPSLLLTPHPVTTVSQSWVRPKLLSVTNFIQTITLGILDQF